MIPLDEYLKTVAPEVAREQLQLAIAGLQTPNPPRCRGICALLDVVPWAESTALRILRTAVFRTWDKFSGDTCYPVPAPADWVPTGFAKAFLEDYSKAELCFGYACAVGANDPVFGHCRGAGAGLWAGEYGDLRRELLAHILETFNGYLEQLNASN